MGSVVKNIPEPDIKTYVQNAAGFVPGLSSQQVTEHYQNWSNKYDNEMNESIYRGPKIAANLCETFLNDKSLRILDVGAGTGFLGKHLADRGFTNIDGLEPSEKMVEVARSKNAYTKFYLEGVYAGKQTSVPSNMYDACVIVGSFGEGHIPTEGLRELIRLVKPGGYIINVMRKEYLDYVQDYVDRLEPLMERLEKEENVWSLVTQFEMDYYFSNKVGKAFVHKKNI